jgi:regulatory protein
MDETAVFDQAVRWLAQRPYGVAELARRLKQRLEPKGIDPHLIEHVIAKCQRLGYLDDERFAVSFIRYRMLQRGQGERRLRHELRERGVSDTLITQALEQVTQEEPEAATPEAVARAALIKQFGGGTPPDRKGLKRRFDFLARRGFDSETIWRVLKSQEDG